MKHKNNSKSDLLLIHFRYFSQKYALFYTTILPTFLEKLLVG